jgi:hypothetical protein
MGAGAAHAATAVATNCAWEPGSGGCSFVTQASVGTGIWVAWANGTSTPMVNGQAPIFCFANAGGAGLCTYSITTTPGATVTVTADPGSAGVASEQDNL